MTSKNPTPQELRQQAERLLSQANDLEQQPPITRERLREMTPHEIVQAKADGRLDDLLGIRTPSTQEL